MALVNFFGSFQYQWGQAATSYAWDDAQWKNGWAAIGSTPPSVAQFDAVQKITDFKTKYLFDAINGIAIAGGWTLDAGNAGDVKSVLFRAPTTTLRGMPEAASASEVQTGSDNAKMVTPSALAARSALTNRTGLVALATNAEVQTGTDSAKAVTSAALSSRTATTARTGLVALATKADADAGTDQDKVLTPSIAAASYRIAPSATVRGMPLVASAAQAETGTATDLMITPALLAASAGRRGTTIISANSSFTVPAGVTKIFVTATGGGGGGGGGGSGNSSATVTGGGGGGAGAESCFMRAFTVTPGATLAVVIGAAGASGTGGTGGGNGGNGGNGGTTTIAALSLSLSGGGGGGGTRIADWGNTGGPGYGAISADASPQNISGSGGCVGIGSVSSTMAALAFGGAGGSSIFGGGESIKSWAWNSAGLSAKTSGAGGSGGQGTSAGGSTGGAGGAGGAGVVIITW